MVIEVMTGAIETSNLTKRYGDVTALEGIDLSVEKGEVFGFLGPNGAGKTTTIDILLDFIRPTAGTASVLGADAQTETDRIRQRVGVLPDGFDLWERSTGYEHLEFGLASTGGSEDPEALLERVGLAPDDARRPVGEYSRGMLQRLGLALALVGDPDLLILDEPSSGLDPHGIQMMQDLVRTEAEAGTTVFFSSHILGQVSAVCDRVGILEAGELVTVDTIAGLREDAGVGGRLVATVEDDAALDSERLEGLEGVTAVDGNAERLTVKYASPATKPLIVHRLIEDGVTIRDFRIEEATLEELFRAYTDANGTSEPTTAGDQGSIAESEAETAPNANAQASGEKR